MAYTKVQGGRPVPCQRKGTTAPGARGRGFSAGRWVLAAGFALAFASPPRAHAQALGGAASPYAPLSLTAQPAKPGGEPERIGQPRPAGEGPLEAPPPRRVDSFLEAHPRLRGLPAGTAPPPGTTPVPSKEEEQLRHKYVGPFVDPAYTIELIENRPRLWFLKEVPFRIQVGDESMLSYNIIGQTPRELSLLGRRVGVTVLNVWFGDRQDISKQTVLSFQVNILPDPEEKERLERVYKALEDEINRAFPDAQVCLFLVGDKVVLTGQVKDAVESTKIYQIVAANVQRQRRQQDQRDPNQRQQGQQQQPLPQTIPVQAVEAGLPPGAPPGALAGVGLNDYVLRSELDVINMLRIPGEQQVMLKVIVAEVSRSAARSIGVDFSITNNSGTTVFSQMTGNLLGNNNGNGGTGAAGAAAGAINGANRGSLTNATNQGQGANLMAILDNGKIPLAIQALRTIDLARSLAEPNLVTLNGRPATFRAGGEFPVPVVTGATNVGLQGVSFVPFGVLLTFTPIITDKDRIRLQFAAEVSTRDVATGANIGTGTTTSTLVPGLTTRDVNTTVEMREGQTLAIGGLLQTNLGGKTRRVPFFGDLPFGGQFFRRDDTEAEESELIILVTPELVHPMEPREVPPLPGSDYFEPGDLEFYLHGNLESRRAYDYRSPVMNDLHRMCAYRHCELLYFVGPHGHCDGR